MALAALIRHVIDSPEFCHHFVIAITSMFPEHHEEVMLTFSFSKGYIEKAGGTEKGDDKKKGGEILT